MKYLAVVVVAALLSARATFACNVGCPCGNSCISCSDTCHVGQPPPPSDPVNTTSNGDALTPILVTLGAIVTASVCIGSGIAFYVFDPFNLFHAPPPDFAPDVDGLNRAGEIAFWGCLPKLCAQDGRCREAKGKELGAAKNKKRWLIDNGCVEEDGSSKCDDEGHCPND